MKKFITYNNRILKFGANPLVDYSKIIEEEERISNMKEIPEEPSVFSEINIEHVNSPIVNLDDYGALDYPAYNEPKEKVKCGFKCWMKKVWNYIVKCYHNIF